MEIAHFGGIPTPTIVLDAATVRGNIDRLAAYGASHRIAVRPHTKTHKSIEVAALQLAAGARGLTVAKVGEAEALLPTFADRAPDFLMAYPTVDAFRTRRLAALAGASRVRIAADTTVALDATSAAATAAGTQIGVLVDLDVGMGRTGVPTAAALVALAQAADKAPGLRLDGILCYPGHIWA